ncbi:trigger factor [bacterium]|nr:trigger factor [bacterium]
MAKNTEKITIEIKGEAWEKALDKSFKKNVKKANIDGFRKGNVPKDIYLKNYGMESLFEDAYLAVVDDAFKEAQDKAKVKAEIQPSVDIKKIDKDGITFEFTFIGKPEIKLGQYKDLKVKKEKVAVTKEEVDAKINELREQFADITVKEGGVVETGDTAVIDFVGEVDGKPLDGGSGENYPLEIGTNTFIPGFEDGVLGMKVDETKDLHLKFPENYTKELAGKEVVFHVTLREIKSRILPDIDENFFEDLGYDKVTNAEELAKEVENTIKEEKENEEKNRFLEEVLKQVSEKMEVDVPEEIIDDEVHRMIHQWKEQLKSQGLTLDQYMEFTGTTHEDMHKQMEPEALRRVKYRYMLEAVSEAEKIEVTDEEVEKDIEEMATNYGISKEELVDAFGGKEVLAYDSKMRKTLKFLEENN